jgi:RNA-binding protein YhbY
MRKTGDKRADSIIKVEFYKEYIEGNYNCLYWIDDRKQVIDAIRQELGLIVLDVAGNTFRIKYR